MDSPKENSPPKFHPYRDQQHSKSTCKSISFGDGTEHQDSGYASAYVYSTTNIEHDLMFSSSAAGSFHVQHKRDSGDSCNSRHHLEPIVEGIEIGQFVAKLNAFHITTPSSPSPVKRPASSPITHIDNTRLRTMRLNSITPHTPKEATASDGNVKNILSGRKLWQQRRETIRSKLNVDDDDVFSTDEDSNGLQAPSSLEYSPIIGIRRNGGGLTIAGVLQEKKKRTRNASEHTLQSSTPIDFDALNQAKGNTIPRGSNVEWPRSFAARNKDLRKSSFSPSKHFQSIYERNPTTTTFVSDLPVLSTHSPNPARKLLDFNEDEFDTLVQPAQKDLQRQYAIDTNTDYLNMSPARHAITTSQYMNESLNIAGKIDIFKVEKTPPYFLNMSITPPKYNAMDLCSPIDNTCWVIPSPVQENTSSQHILKNGSSYTDSNQQFDLLLHSDTVLESPNPSPFTVEDTQRTPKKQSHGFDVFNSSPRHEQNCILYPKLQRTPPRDSQRLLKQLSSSQGIQRTPVKRKLFQQTRTYASFEGYERLDIFGRLENKLPAIDSLLKCLSSPDLANVTEVSKRWCRIVNSRAVASRRLEHYRRNQKCRQDLQTSLKLTVNAPSLSPQKAKEEEFLNHIMLVSLMKTDQQVMKCPRCQKTSIVHNPSDSSAMCTTKLKTSLSAEYRVPTTSSLPFRKQKSFSLLDGNSFSHHASKDLISPPSPPNEHLDSFAQCTSKRCSYRFCPKCLCEFHLNDKCMSREIGAFNDIENTTGKEYVAGSKGSKRNLRRLCSLNN